MALNKKGMSLLGIVLYFILFYIPMTLIVKVLLLNAQESVLSSRLYAGGLDDSFLLSRTVDRVSYADLNTGRIYPCFIEDLAMFNENTTASMFYFHADKPTAINLTIGQKSSVFNQAYYEIAYPLAPVRYRLLTAQKEMLVLKDRNTTGLDIKIVSTKKIR